MPDASLLFKEEYNASTSISPDGTVSSLAPFFFKN
jgi:hypothetical protein